MELYVCWGTFPVPGRPGGHPCGNAYQRCARRGTTPRSSRSYGLGILPDLFNRTTGRREAKRLTGKRMVPVLVTDDGEVVADSKEIVAWAREHPAARRDGLEP